MVLISEDGEKQRQCWNNEGDELIVPIEEGMDHLGKVRMAYEQKYEEVLVTALMGIRYYQVGADGPVQLKEGACGVVLGSEVGRCGKGCREGIANPNYLASELQIPKSLG